MTLSDHERCSELLTDHLAGHLSASDAAWVADHLAGCSDCRAEESAVRAMALEEVAPLTEVERARLRRAVLAEAQPSSAEAVTAARGPRRSGRMLQILGTAALLVMIGGFIYTTGLSGGDDAALRGGEGGGGADSAESGPAPVARDDSVAEQEMGASSEGTAATSDASAPEPTFRRSLGEITGRRLNRFGRQGLPLVVFSRAYRAEHVPELQTKFRDQLAAAAGAEGDSVTTCSDLVTSAFPNALPAYGALGTLDKLDGDEVLVLAFAWTDEDSGPLDQSMVWAWPVDNCDQPVEYYKNVIEPRR